MSGKRLVWCDWSAIEARVAPWLAIGASADATRSARRVLSMFRDGVCVYLASASDISGEKITDKEDPRRQSLGKVPVLSLGFLGGLGALNNMARNYGLPMFDNERGSEIVRKWRAANPWAPDFGKALEDQAKRAIRRPGEPFPAGRCTLLVHPMLGGTLLMYLPCGRPLCYPRARIEEIERFEGQPEPTIVYDHAEFGKTALWKGAMIENCLSGAAQVVTDRGLVRLDEVTLTHRVWDGEEFVAHQGLTQASEQATLSVDGVRMTADHRVLTSGGWVAAAQCEGYDRAEIRLPDGSCTGGFYGKEPAVALPLRLRHGDRAHRVGGGAQARAGKPLLWVYGAAPASREACNTWHVETPGLRRMALHARPLPTAFASRMGELWRTWHNGVRALARAVRALLAGYGAGVAEGAFAGSAGQREGIFARELRVAQSDRAKQEQTHEYLCQDAMGPNHGCRVVGADRHRADNPAIPTGARRERAGFVVEAGSFEAVYDLKNCGPRSRFVVLSDAGPMAVHNCTQGLAASLLRTCLVDLERGAVPNAQTVTHTHDEIVMECNTAHVEQVKEELVALMSKPPEYASDLPLAAEAGAGYRYYANGSEPEERT